MKKIIQLSLSFFIIQFSNGQFIKSPIGANALSSAYISSVLSEDPFAAKNHNAWSCFQEKNYLYLDVKNHFLIKELNTVNLGVNIHKDWGNLSFFLSQYGYTYFKEQTFTISIAKRLSEYFSLGSQFASRYEFVNNEYQSSIYNINVNTAFLLGPKWKMGSAIDAYYVSKTSSRFRISLKQGFSYQLSTLVHILSELELNQNIRRLKFSIIFYQESWSLSFGSTNRLSSLFIGSEIHLPVGRVSIAFQIQQQLGLSPNLSYAHEL